MTDSDFEKYYQKGGTYVLPIEVFNELFGEMENWKKECKQKENIIKEVRDKKEELMYLASKCSIIYRNNIEVVAIYDRLKELFEILDKGE